MTIEEQKKEEEYLFKIARIVLNWADVKLSKEDEESLADLVMLNLLNVKK